MDTQIESGRGYAAGPIVLVSLLVVGLLLGGGVSYALWAGGDAPDSAGRSACVTVDTVDVVVDPVLYRAVVEALSEGDQGCTRIQAVPRDAGQVALAVSQGAALPDVWIADSRFWMSPTYLGRRTGLRVVSPRVATTPVLLVGGPASRRFGSWGEAEISGLVTVPDPLTSTAGSLAVGAPEAEAAAMGRTAEQARQMLVPFAQKYGERRSHGLDEDTDLLSSRRTSPRVFVATERDLAEAQQQAGYLRDRTPRTGAPLLEYAMAVPREGVPGAGRTARSLVEYLSSPDGLQTLGEAGLRDGEGQPIAGAAGTVDVTRFLATPPSPTLASAVQSWRTLSVPSSILAVVDASGSMDFAAGARTRMEILVEAADLGLSFLPGHARVGLWIFSIDKGGPDQDWRILEPVHRLDRLAHGRTQLFALRARAREMPGLTGGGTGLYDTALAAYRQALRDYRPYYSNAVVLMTDGANDDPGSIGLNALVRRLAELRDPDRPVRIVGIAISADADVAALRRIGGATGGTAYLAARPEDILEVFAKAVLSR